MQVSKIILGEDPVPAESSAGTLDRKLSAALAAESVAQRDHGAACLARETGDPTSNVDATAASLAAAETQRRNIEAAIASARLAAQQTVDEREAADLARGWATVEALLDRRIGACTRLQESVERVASDFREAALIGAQLWEALPVRPQHVPSTWPLAQAIQLALYAASEGAIAAHGVIDSPHTIRTERPGLKAQAAAHREFFLSLRS